MTENTPINNTQRIQVVDALRGFAIIAIMLVHFLEHFIYNSYPVSSSPAMASVNETVKEAFFFLFAGKSYTMFALLFGFTYAIQYGNQLKKGKDFAGRFAWRLCLLAGFACLNAIFFPGGDILLTFATVGFILIPARRLSTTALVLASFFFSGSAAGNHLCCSSMDITRLDASHPACAGILSHVKGLCGFGQLLVHGLA